MTGLPDVRATSRAMSFTTTPCPIIVLSRQKKRHRTMYKDHNNVAFGSATSVPSHRRVRLSVGIRFLLGRHQPL